MILERFVIPEQRIVGKLDKSSETLTGDKIIGPVGRQELHDGVIFILGSHTADTLPPIDVKDPHRYTVYAGNTWEKTRKGLGDIVIIDDKLAGFVQGVW
jgi:hypothetical protein